MKIDKKKFGKLVRKIRKARNLSKRDVLIEYFGPDSTDLQICESNSDSYNRIEKGLDQLDDDIVNRLSCILKVPTEVMIAMTCPTDDKTIKALQKRMRNILITAIKCNIDTEVAFDAEILNEVGGSVNND